MLCIEFVPLHGERLLNVQGVVLYVEWGNIDKEHIACDASVVPPVENLCRNILCMTLVVHFYDDGVLTLLELFGHIEVERCKATNVVSHFLTIYIDVAIIIDSTEIEQGVATLSGMPIKTFLEPYCAFVEKQALVSCVPVRGDGHSGRGVEVIFDKVFWTLRFCIAEKAP